MHIFFMSCNFSVEYCDTFVFVIFVIKRGRPRKTPLENAPASVPHPGDVTSNMMSTRGRRKRQLSKHNENENNKIVEPTSNNDDPNDKEDREDEGNEGKEELRIKEENMIHLGGDDVERKMIYAAVEKTSGGWLCTVCGKLSSAKHNLLGENSMW